MTSLWKEGQEQGQQQQREVEDRIYLVTDGLNSPATKQVYGLVFNHFIKTTVKNEVLRALLDTKQSVIESKIIDHINYLHEVQHLGYLSIQTHLSGILRFFAMNDYHLNIKKIRRFLPEDAAYIQRTERADLNSGFRLPNQN